MKNEENANVNHAVRYDRFGSREELYNRIACTN